MANQLAWDIMNKVVLTRTKYLKIETFMTIHSTEDWDNGVGLQTEKGTIHVLGTGEIVDENDVLKYQ
ncbi:hypothetical protein PQE68_gp039 [Bacillus phage vB_BanS_Sophrita]|uniref:Uncharacterized protein n=1 Tax=Bacillus phage vB_BanS_Sophrita TaxID=2894790 RepID=A0AAE8YTS6_9CAUD|nr:hypothetical protein PQE68_gp039 [Bacillus phage vB_BanS_Sophrita]UGO50630.1 hypothetical protein SOPHRITA_39 [Bacillus phage vB_BanS_Sophrita]